MINCDCDFSKQGLGSDIKHNALDLRYKTTLDDYNYDTVAAGNIVESNIVNFNVERSRSSDSSTVYNEPFSEDAYSFCVPPKLKHAVSSEDMAIGKTPTFNNVLLNTSSTAA